MQYVQGTAGQIVGASGIPFVQNATRTTTARILAGWQAMQANTRNMKGAAMGSSVDKGVDEGALPYNSQYAQSVTEKLAARFRALGIAAGANNLFGISGNNFADYMGRDGRAASTGATTAFSVANQCLGGSEIEFPTAAGTFSFTPPDNTSLCELTYQDSLAGRAFNWNVDEGTDTLITTVGANNIIRTNLALGSVGAHTINLAWSAGFVRIFAFNCYDATRKEINLRNYAISGGTTSNMIEDVGTPAAGRQRHFILDPVDFVHGDFGLPNSWRAGRSIANCETDLSTLFDLFVANNSNFIFVVPPFDTSSAGNTAQQDDYIAMAKAKTIQKGGIILDIRARWKSKANSDALGFTRSNDAIHKTIAGQDDTAAALMPLLRWAMGV